MKKIFMFLLFAMFIVAIGYSQSITITSPHSGNCWEKGKTYTITWTKSGTMNANVKIRLYQGGTKILSITDSTPNNGSYGWTVPATVADGSYYIRVKTTDNAVYDDSDTFQIKTSCSSGSSYPFLNLKKYLAGMNLGELAVYMHGPGPRIRNFDKIKNLFEKANFKEPVTIKLFKGRTEITNLGTFRPEIRNGRVNFNTVPSILNVNLNSKQKEMMIENPENCFLVFFSKSKIIGRTRVKVKLDNGRLSKIPKFSPKTFTRSSDLAAVKLSLTIYRSYRTINSKTYIRMEAQAIIQNIGKNNFRDYTGKSWIYLNLATMNDSYPLENFKITSLSVKEKKVVTKKFWYPVDGYGFFYQEEIDSGDATEVDNYEGVEVIISSPFDTNRNNNTKFINNLKVMNLIKDFLKTSNFSKTITE